MWLVKSLVGDRPSWHKEPINFLNIMLSIRKVRLLITSRYIAMQSYECVIISKMFLIYFISHGCNGGALVFLGGAEASASPSFALPMFITIKKRIILHLFLAGTPVATPLMWIYKWIFHGCIWLQIAFKCIQKLLKSTFRKKMVVNLLILLTQLYFSYQKPLYVLLAEMQHYFGTIYNSCNKKALKIAEAVESFHLNVTCFVYFYSRLVIYLLCHY